MSCATQSINLIADFEWKIWLSTHSQSCFCTMGCWPAWTRYILPSRFSFRGWTFDSYAFYFWRWPGSMPPRKDTTTQWRSTTLHHLLRPTVCLHDLFTIYGPLHREWTFLLQCICNIQLTWKWLHKIFESCYYCSCSITSITWNCPYVYWIY